MAKASSAYGLSSPLISVARPAIIARRSPTALDIDYDQGQVWIDELASQAWTFLSAAGGSAVWGLMTPGASDVDTLQGDAGGVISPLAGNITLAGGANITTTGAVNTITFDLDNAISLITSVTSPLYLAGAGVDTQIRATAGQNVVIRMGDDAGANKISFTNLSNAEVFALNSLGTLSMAALTVVGALTQTAGVVNIGQDNAANAINIGGGTTARAVGIANSAAAHVLTLGSVTAAAQTLIRSGTAGMALSSTGLMTLDSAGVLELNSSAGVIGIGNDAVAQAINIGTGAAQRTITIGNTSAASSVIVDVGTGDADFGVSAFAHRTRVGSVTGASATTVQAGSGALIVNGGGAVTVDAVGVLELNSSGAAIGIGNDASAFGINVGTGAAQRDIVIGNITGTTSVLINGGTGAMDFGVNATDHTTRVGSVTGVSATTLNAGTGAMSLVGGGVMDLDAAGILSLNSSAAVINIGNDVVAQAINIGTGGARTITIGSGTGATSVLIPSGTGAAQFGANATDHPTTIGSTVGVSALTLQGGTGRITVTGTVKEIDAVFLARTGDDITFQASPVMQSALNTGVAPTGANGDVNLMLTQEGIAMEQFIIGTQTIIAPRMDANGLLVSLDLTVAEGAEYNFGAARANSRHAFTIGTSPAFFFELQFRIADMDGADPYLFGFRKVAANNANWQNYSDYSLAGMIASTSTTTVVLATELNGGGTTITNTTDAWGGDGTTNTLRINVSAVGVVTYLINGIAPSVTAAFSFDNADVISPVIIIKHSATPSAVDLVSMKIGYQI